MNNQFLQKILILSNSSLTLKLTAIKITKRYIKKLEILFKNSTTVDILSKISIYFNDIS